MERMWKEAFVTSSDIRTRNSSVQTDGNQEKFSTAGVGLKIDTTPRGYEETALPT
jgi:hypothetical protein